MIVNISAVLIGWILGQLFIDAFKQNRGGLFIVALLLSYATAYVLGMRYAFLLPTL